MEIHLETNEQPNNINNINLKLDLGNQLIMLIIRSGKINCYRFYIRAEFRIHRDKMLTWRINTLIRN